MSVCAKCMDGLLLADREATIEALQAENADLRASREMWATARSEELSLDLASRPAPPEGPGPWVWKDGAWVGTLEVLDTDYDEPWTYRIEPLPDPPRADETPGTFRPEPSPLRCHSKCHTGIAGIRVHHGACVNKPRAVPDAPAPPSDEWRPEVGTPTQTDRDLVRMATTWNGNELVPQYDDVPDAPAPSGEPRRMVDGFGYEHDENAACNRIPNRCTPVERGDGKP